MLGTTDFRAEEIQRIVEEMGRDFQGDRYHLINKNCNHFTSMIAQVGGANYGDSLVVSPPGC